MKVIRLIIFAIIFSIFTPTQAEKVEKNDYFYTLSTQQGLADNHILQMLQLSDGKMAVETFKGINIYDGKKFHFIPLSPKDAQTISLYDGHIHLYADKHNRLWVKNTQQVFCIDLTRNQLIKSPIPSEAKDVFIDSHGEVWCNLGRGILKNEDSQQTIHTQEKWGTIQDLDVDNEHVYTFHANGIVAAFTNSIGTAFANSIGTDRANCRLAYTLQAYDKNQAVLYKSTSLTAKTPHGQFYQIRTGVDPKTHQSVSIFLHFDPIQRKYEKIYNCAYILHTLNMSSDHQALISSQEGYLMFDFKIGNTPREVHELALPNGKSLTTGINTVYKDDDGGIWLGTYNDGLIYVSPMLGLFFTIDNPWWKSGWAIALVAFLLLAMAGGFYYLIKRRKTASALKQENQINTISSEETKEDFAETKETTSLETTSQETTSQEPAFVAQARSIVEQHLQDSEYGVEQLAKELCMERTGLYKKLTSLSDTTPVVFIRNIRLERAALLLKEGNMSVNEIAEKTGFSSPSYFTKCFKKMYGVLPSEYR